MCNNNRRGVCCGIGVVAFPLRGDGGSRGGSDGPANYVLPKWYLRLGESVDVDLAELKELTFLLGGMSERMLASAFVHGLTGNVKQTLRALSRMDALSIDQLLTRARAIIRDERGALIAGTGENQITNSFFCVSYSSVMVFKKNKKI